MRRRTPVILTLVAAAALATGCSSGDAQAPAPAVQSSRVSSAAPTSASPRTPLVTVTPAVNDTTVVATPLEDSVVAGPSIEVTGEATAFEGNLSWLVYPADGSADNPAQRGATMTGANGVIGPFSFVVELEPGTWVVQVFEESAKDGTPLRPVAVTFTVS
ncbi:Gmad2 immunoglobulin-like domain-containing protein [Sanguibacter sp. A247]|uniref:Gmad2 immunoglobulin-like domain-containing protein n=1 Tax=unclassified Sanguibacter TaxID=2645534 RepID=UPI003FD6C7DA